MEDRHVVVEANEIYHHGVKGQKWGVRRFQTYSGEYTPEGRIRYGIGRKKYGLDKTNKDGVLTNKEYGNLRILKDKVNLANDEWDNADWGRHRRAAGKKRDKAYKEFDNYGISLVKRFANSNEEFQKALNERKEFEKKVDEEWKRISDQDHIDSIGRNKKDPRSKHLDKVGDHYEFSGDGSEFWDAFANKDIKDQLTKAEDRYHKACYDGMCTMFSDVMDTSIWEALKYPYYRYDTRIMDLPVTSRMSDYMVNHFYDIA